MIQIFIVTWACIVTSFQYILIYSTNTLIHFSILQQEESDRIWLFMIDVLEISVSHIIIPVSSLAYGASDL